MLIRAFLLACFRPDKPFPILYISGEKGTAKSTLLGLIRKLIDPISAGGAGVPQKEDDLVSAAANSWLVSGDNVSFIKPEMADVFCRLSTGGGIIKRQLYTDGDVFKIEAKRPVALTGIIEPTGRNDFLDRTILVELRRIEGERKTEEEIEAQFNAVYPKILGALLDAVVAGLKTYQTVEVEDRIRLADFGIWAEATAQYLGEEPGVFTAVFLRMRNNLFEQAATGDIVVQALLAWREKQTGEIPPEFTFRPNELYKKLTDQSFPISQPKEWPKTAATFCGRLKRSRDSLLQVGLDAELTRHTSENTARIVIKDVAGFVRLRCHSNRRFEGGIPKRTGGWGVPTRRGGGSGGVPQPPNPRLGWGKAGNNLL